MLGQSSIAKQTLHIMAFPTFRVLLVVLLATHVDIFLKRPIPTSIPIATIAAPSSAPTSSPSNAPSSAPSNPSQPPTVTPTSETHILTVENITGASLEIWFENQGTELFALNDIDPFFNAAFGTIDRKVWILGGEIYDNIEDETVIIDYTRYIDLDTLEMINTNISAPSLFTLWSDSSTHTNDSIYYIPAQSTNFYKFNCIDRTYTSLTSVPNGYGLSCLVSFENPNDNLWYIYSLGGTGTGWWPSQKTTYMYNISSDEWTLMPGQLAIKRFQHSCAITDRTDTTNNELAIYLFGGRTGSSVNSNNTIEYCIIDVNGNNMINNDCIKINEHLSQSKQETRSFLFNKNLILILGGKKDVSNSINDIEILDISNSNHTIYHDINNLSLNQQLSNFVYSFDTKYNILYIWSGEIIIDGSKSYADSWDIGCIFDQTYSLLFSQIAPFSDININTCGNITYTTNTPRITTTPASVYTIIGGGATTRCDASWTQCKIECNNPSQCGDNGLLLGQGTEIHCPNPTGCNLCSLICSDNYSCQGAVLYGYHCKSVNVTIGNGVEPAQAITIFAPDNNGSLIVSTSSYNGGTDAFRNSIIYSNKTGDIILNCYQSASGDDECRNVIIYGKDSNYVELNCYHGTQCQDTTVHCPINASNEEDDQASCQIECQSADDCTIDVYIDNSGWDNNKLNIENYTWTTNGGITIYCNGDTVDSCIMSNSGVYDCSYNSGTGCSSTFNPTTIPTNVPSDLPSKIPFNVPTTIPTTTPSTSPTTSPVATTVVPSTQPTTGLNQTSSFSTHFVTNVTSLKTTRTTQTTNVTSLTRSTHLTTNMTLQQATQSRQSSTSTTKIKSINTTKTKPGVSISDGEEYQSWQDLSYLLIFIAAIMVVIIVVAAFIYHKCVNSKGCDRPDFVAIFRFVNNCANFVINILFTFVLFDQNSKYSSINAVFVFSPHLLSCMVGLYWIERWRVRKDWHLLKYLSKYDGLIYISSVIFGFYSTINLLQSKLFGLKVFNFEISQKKSDYNDWTQLQNYRFVNLIILGTVPQMIIQILYITSSNDIENGYKSPVADMALIFSLLSLTIGIMVQFSRICQHFRHRNVKFLHNNIVTCRLFIKCDSLHGYHECTHNKLESCLNGVLRLSSSLMDLHHRLDTSFCINVYHIESNIELLKSMIVMFEMNILSDEYDANNKNSLLSDLIIENIVRIGDKKSENFHQMRNALIRSLKLKEQDNIDIKCEIVKNQRFSLNIRDVSCNDNNNNDIKKHNVDVVDILSNRGGYLDDENDKYNGNNNNNTGDFKHGQIVSPKQPQIGERRRAATIITSSSGGEVELAQHDVNANNVNNVNNVNDGDVAIVYAMKENDKVILSQTLQTTITTDDNNIGDNDNNRTQNTDESSSESSKIQGETETQASQNNDNIDHFDSEGQYDDHVNYALPQTRQTLH